MSEREPLFNVGMVCKDHAPKPGRFKDSDPSKLLGEMVKLGFPAKHPLTGKETKEHMWVKVHTVIQPGTYQTGEELVGTLNNDPVLDTEYQNGDDVAFKVDEIEDVFIDFES
jgi:uncharacterized protein YegJ (DUF2314 family)